MSRFRNRDHYNHRHEDRPEWDATDWLWIRVALVLIFAGVCVAEWIAPRYIEDTPRPVSVEIERRVT